MTLSSTDNDLGNDPLCRISDHRHTANMLETAPPLTEDGTRIIPLELVYAAMGWVLFVDSGPRDGRDARVLACLILQQSMWKRTTCYGTGFLGRQRAVNCHFREDALVAFMPVQDKIVDKVFLPGLGGLHLRLEVCPVRARNLLKRERR